MDKIILGYEIGSGIPVEISPGHLIVTGITQLSGKTTTLEALIKRSGMKAIVFKTKIGEKGFSEGTEIAPFFRDRSDYEFVRSLIEAYAKEKLFLEKGTLMQLCKGSRDLVDIKKRVDDTVAGGLKGLKEEIYIRLQHYLENLIPQIQYANLSRTLGMVQGINIMNLERFTEEAQSLIIQSVIDEVLKTTSDTIIVIPEAWKFVPQKYNNPCKRSIESYIRQGATNHNYIWIDSQDMAGVDKSPLKQISTWILGYQAERNEVKHTLDQISLPKKLKPHEEEIMTLKIGQFYLSSYDGVKKVYVQPSWMDTQTAIKIAIGDMNVQDTKRPELLVPFSKQPMIAVIDARTDTLKVDAFGRDIIELRKDFFNKIDELQDYLNKLSEKVYELQSKPVINEADIVQKILQKMPVHMPVQQMNHSELINEIISKLPKVSGGVSYQVVPLEKIKKDFLEETKQKLLADISKLSPEELKIIKFVESTGKGVNQTELVSRCFFLSATSGGSRTKVLNWCKEIETQQFIRRDKNSVVYPYLKDRLKDMLQFHGATEQEIEQLYQHII